MFITIYIPVEKIVDSPEKESPLGAAIIVAVDTVLWRSFTCMTSSKHNQVSIPLKRFRIRLSDDGDCNSSH